MKRVLTRLVMCKHTAEHLKANPYSLAGGGVFCDPGKGQSNMTMTPLVKVSTTFDCTDCIYIAVFELDHVISSIISHGFTFVSDIELRKG